MKKNYLAKIIAKDPQGLQLISAYCFEAKVKVNEIKFLKTNKIFLLSLERFSHENNKNKEKINSICKFEFVDNVKSKNIDQNNKDEILELLALDFFKKDECQKNSSVVSFFTNKSHALLRTISLRGDGAPGDARLFLLLRVLVLLLLLLLLLLL